jgi:hypothetical protein
LLREDVVDDLRTEPVGIKGWLFLFCVLLMIFDPLVIVVTLFVVSDGLAARQDLGREMFRLIFVTGVLKIGLAVFSLYAGVSLWRRAPRAVTLARTYLVAIGLSSVAFLFLPVLLGSKMTTAEALSSENVLNVLLTVVYVLLWLAYLSRSKRVRATYGLQEGGG